MHRDGSNSNPGGSSGEPANLLDYVCESCVTAFEEAYDFCPTCHHPRPDAGWRNTHHYPDNWLGRTIQRYRIERRLGKGTFGSVYLAKRAHLEDAYAIKIINLHNSNLPEEGPTIRERVQREVRILSSLSTPHIVDFHDFLELPGGSVAVVMDYVQGETLAEILSGETRFELERAIQFAIEIATALYQAHQRGAVHRDLKPDNVMVRNLGGRREFVQLIDFGVARFEFEVSQTVGFIGTPRYTSPEQARGKSADHASDIYNLGMLIFHMIVGEPPYPGKDVSQLLRAHSRQKAPGLAATARDRQIPPELDQLVAAMMAKSPVDRPADMQRVTDRLRAIQQQFGDADEQSDSAADETSVAEHATVAASTPEETETHNIPFGALHETDDHMPLKETRQGTGPQHGFERRPPSDVFDVSAEGSIVYRDEDNRVCVRRAGNAPEDDERLFATFSTPVTALTVDGPDRIILGHADGSIRSLDVQTNRVGMLREATDRAPVSALAVTPDGSCIAAGFRDGRAIYRNRREKQAWRTLPEGAEVLAIGLFHDGSCIAVGRSDRTTEVYMPGRSMEHRATQLSHQARPERLEFSPDGYLVAVQFPDGDAKLFSALTGAHLGEASSSLLEPSTVFEDAQD